MTRRSGLGRGLAALIPPSEPDDREHAAEGDDTSGDGATPEGTEGPSAPAVASATDVGDRSAAPTPVGTDGSAADPATEDQDRGRVREISESTFETRSEADEAVQPSTPTPVPGPLTVAPEAVAPEAATPETLAPRQTSDASTAAGDVGVPSAAATLAEVAPASIVPNPRQPREVFDPDELAHLATSLADVGILQPLVVRPLEDGSYELVAGERRLRAAMLAGMSTVPVVIRHTDDANLLKEALVENIHRVQLNPLEEGAAYQQLLEEFGVTQEELATRLGRSRPSISNAIRLLQLPPGVQRRVASGVLSAGHAKVLLAIEDPDQQLRLAERIVAEGMSVRATEELVRLRLLDEPSRSSASRRRPVTAPGLVELQDDLSDALEARVRISMGAKRGRLAIEFASVDDLERIVSVIANGLEGRRDVASVPTTIGDGTAPDPA